MVVIAPLRLVARGHRCVFEEGTDLAIEVRVRADEEAGGVVEGMYVQSEQVTERPLPM